MLGQIDFQYLKLKPSKALKRWLNYFLFEGRPKTSRLYFLNHITMPLLNIISKVPLPSKKLSKIEKPIFIIGMGRSGSTLLGRLLSMHKDISFLNEGIGTWQIIVPFGDIFANFLSMENALRSKLKLTEKDVTIDMYKKAYNIIGWLLLLTNSKRYLDKHSLFTFRIKFIKSLFPDAQFLFLIRNGWDVCLSIQKWNLANRTYRQNNVADWWGINKIKWKLLLDQILSNYRELWFLYEYINANIKDDFNMAAVEYILTNKEGLMWSNTYKQDFYIVRYEDLIKSTNDVLHGIIKFLDLCYDKKMFEYAQINIKRKKSFTNNGSLYIDKIDVKLKPYFLSIMEQLGYL